MLAVRVTESNFVTKPAKLAVKAGANHGGAKAASSAFQALASIKFSRREERTSTGMFSDNSSFLNSSFSDFRLRGAI